MLAYTGTWSTSHYLATERKRLERERVLAADNRRKHRSLDRRERLLKDLEVVDKKLKHYVSKRYYALARATCLLRRRNKLVNALNEYVGTSQSVPLEEV